MSIRVASLEIFKFCGGDKSRRKRWLELACELQYAANRWWQIWEMWHSQNGSANKMRAFLDVRQQWLKDGKLGDKPQAPVSAVPKPLAKLLYDTLTAEFPTLHSRTLVLFLNRMQAGVVKRKAANSSLSGWLSILFAREGRPSFTRPQPIPFDKQPKSPQVTLLPPDESHKNWRISIRIERVAVAGKRATSVQEVCELMTRKRKARRDTSELEKVVAGKAALCGSYLVFDRGKWFIKLTIEEEVAKPALDGSRVARLSPGRHCPWLLHHDTRWRRRGGRGRHVEAFRRKIGFERRERREHYRWAGSASKGHGRRRAEAVWTKLSSRWRDFTKRYNHEVTTSIVRELVRSGVGVLEYWQPEAGSRFAETRFLATSGKLPELRDSTQWDWSQVKTLLAYKCQRVGIEFRCVKRGASIDADGGCAAAVA